MLTRALVISLLLNSAIGVLTACAQDKAEPGSAERDLARFAHVARSDRQSGAPLELLLPMHFRQISESQLELIVKHDSLEVLRFSWSKRTEQPEINVSTIVNSLAKLKNLKILQLVPERNAADPTDRHALCDEDLVEIARLRGLVELTLVGQPITAEGVGHLTSLPALTVLNLNQTDVGDDSVAALLKCKKLESLSVSGSRVTVFGAEELLSKGKLRRFTGGFESGGWLERTRERLKLIDVSKVTRFGTSTQFSTFPEPLPELRLTLFDNKDASTWIRFLVARTRLQALSLARSDVTDEDLKLLSDCETLEELCLDSTMITDVGIETLSEIPNLRVLTLYDCKASSACLQHLARMPKLEVLHLSRDHVGPGFRWLAEAKSLRELAVAECEPESTRHLAALEQCSQLEKLALSGRPHKISDQELAFLEGLENLKHLGLSFFHIDGSCLGKLPHPEKLLSLHVDQSKLRDEHLRVMERMTELRSLSLFSPHLSGACIGHLKSLAKLETLRLVRGRGNTIGAAASKKDMSAFLNLKELRHLHLLSIQVPSDGFESLSALGNLEFVSVSGADLDNRAILHLSKLPKLRVLHVSGPKIDDRVIPHLLEMQKLVSLNIAPDGLSEDGRARLKEKIFSTEFAR